MKLPKNLLDPNLHNQFLLKIVGDRWNGNRELFADLVEQASDSDDLARLIATSEDPKITGSQAWAVASRRLGDGGHWKRLRARLGDRVRKTVSDAGGLKIGNGAFSIIVHNGVGDGITRYAVLEKDEINLMFAMDYFSSVEGEVQIFSYDCGDDVAEIISGRFGVYTYEGIIVFERWE